MKKILVGYLVDELGSGINRYLNNFINEIDGNEFEIDVLTRDNPENIKKMFNSLKINKIHVVERDTHPLKQYNQMKKIFKNNKYEIAYFNVSSCYDSIGMMAAKKCGVPKVIAHSHSSYIEGKNIFDRKIKVILNKIMKPIVKNSCNYYVSCSEKAAEWLFSKRILKEKKYKLIYNCVDDKKFKFNEEKRNNIRKELNIDEKFVIGHVGRFSYQKNHEFLIDIFKNVLEKNKNAVLMCIGEGEDFDRIKQYAIEKKVDKNIIFLGKVENVYDYMQAMDVFVLPSRFEGLPIVGVEAQFSNLPCLFSKKITEDVIIGENSKLLEIDDANIWANEICKINRRENTLKSSAKNFELEYCKKQNQDLLDMNNMVELNNIKSPNLFLKMLLALHFILNLTAYLNGFNYLMVLSAILLIIIIVGIGKNYNKYIKNKMYIILGAFLASYFITFIINTKYNIGGSIKIFIWTVLHFFFTNSYLYITKEKQAKNEIKCMSIWFLIIMSVVNFINLIFLVKNKSLVATSFDGELIPVGLTTWGRFYGIFYDPNYSSVICVVTILMGIYLLKQSEKIIAKIGILFSCLLQLIYIFSCQSRTGLVTLAVGFFAYYVIYYLLNKNKIKIIRKIAVLILFILLISVGPKVTVKVYNYFNSQKYNVEKMQDESDEDKQEKYKIDRKDINGDISNRRFDIWKSRIRNI